MRDRRLAALIFTMGLFLGCVIMFACTPAERRDLAPLIAPTEKAVCVALRVEGVGDLCPTADELAPLAAQLLAFQVERPIDAPPPKPIARLPSTRATRARACVPVQTVDGGDARGIILEGGTGTRIEAGARERDPSAGRIDGGDKPLDGSIDAR